MSVRGSQQDTRKPLCTNWTQLGTKRHHWRDTATRGRREKYGIELIRSKRTIQGHTHYTSLPIFDDNTVNSI